MAVNLIVLGVLMLLSVCWVIGARSRMLRLREAVKQTASALGTALDQQAEGLLSHTSDEAQSDVPEVLRLRAAAAQVQVAWQQSRLRKPFPNWAMVRAAYEVQLLAVQGIKFIKNDEVSSDKSQLISEKEAILLEGVELQLHAERVQASEAAYNEAATRYNQAITMFPAHGLAFVLRLRAADVFSSPSPQP